MMQANEVQQRINPIKQTIQHASQARDSTGRSVPCSIKNSSKQLDHCSDQGSKKLQQFSAAASLRQRVDEFERRGDPVKTACESAANVDQKLKDAVIKAHRELFQRKYQLH